ncbi:MULTISPECIES: alkaline phosphatase family protein [unclassified Microbacterium]|uniref:alkaline phosphatase family protein n=1 Tax=unclassified Microbacterium TaxID=2609290 RepID=UPI0016052B6C|nr:MULTISPECIES: ectonucleotide pyrophosphatase/phosphodiesterase [unclassified Microbacterium]QNA93927.1 alkaline phosphatase family protein [Microbacterium sp. Se63.02b]QYM64241.1 alkaline phosphatase family protein [Microbacterium sp. Se5.02b]
MSGFTTRSRTRAAGGLGLLATVALAAGATVGAAPAAAMAGGDRGERPPLADHVVLIALDGFDPDYLAGDAMPNLRALATRGAISESTGVMTSITNPSWSSIATGAWPETHDNAAYFYDPATGVAVAQQRDLAVPTIAESIREQGGTVLSSQWFIVQNHGTAFGDPQGLYTQPGGDCARRTDDAVAVIEGRPVMSAGAAVQMSGVPDLIAVYCDRLDALGHADGKDAPGMPAAVAEVDAQIGRLVQATKDAGIFGRTAFVVTGDHGMETFTQGMRDELLSTISGAGYQAELLTAGQSPRPETDAVIVVGGVGSLHLVGEAAGDPTAAAAIDAAVSAMPHISAVYDEVEQQAMHMSAKYGELVIEPDEGWSLGAAPSDGVSGVHGVSRTRQTVLVLAGSGVRPNHVAHAPRHVDIAPTIAALLGMDAPAAAEGRVLTEAIRRG